MLNAQLQHIYASWLMMVLLLFFCAMNAINAIVPSQNLSVASARFAAFAKNANCSDGTKPVDDSTVKCLRSLSTSVLLQSKKHLPFDGLCEWSPVVDGVELTAHPMELLAAAANQKELQYQYQYQYQSQSQSQSQSQKGKGNTKGGVPKIAQVPVLFGTNRDEGTEFIGGIK
jgi:L-rhamnose isomerase